MAALRSGSSTSPGSLYGPGGRPRSMGSMFSPPSGPYGMMGYGGSLSGLTTYGGTASGYGGLTVPASSLNRSSSPARSSSYLNSLSPATVSAAATGGNWSPNRSPNNSPNVQASRRHARSRSRSRSTPIVPSNLVSSSLLSTSSTSLAESVKSNASEGYAVSSVCVEDGIGDVQVLKECLVLTEWW